MPCGVWKVGHPARRSAQRPSTAASGRSDSRNGWIGRGPLDQIFTVEQSMEIFHRKDDPGELERAVENFNEMLGSVDRLGELIADAGAKQHATPDAVPDRAA
jgi:hypothetical protein